MEVLVVGGGGREHAIAWTLARSPRVSRVLIAPGNGGTEGEAHGTPLERVPLRADDIDGLQAFAAERGVGLTVIGPEAPLAAGIVDRFQAAGLRCFGPGQDAAQIEASKAFAKSFMERFGLPTGGCRVFTDSADAVAWLDEAPWPVVVKASGLAAGKGVVVPGSRAEAEAAIRDMLDDRSFGEAGAEVLLEERLEGPEISVLAFCDGHVAAPMPLAQDHKRLRDGDLGPNTGGMGAWAPADLLSEVEVQSILLEIFQPALAGMRELGHPYVGVLYAGLMLTEDGPKLLEFNCRLGDPETQVVLPLLESDLVDVIEACLDGRLAETGICWSEGAAATVVAASEGYPGAYPRGRSITGLDAAGAAEGVTVFHAGTRRDGDALVTSGGRVLAVTATAPDAPAAIARAYAGLSEVHFEGLQARSDIGHQALCR